MSDNDIAGILAIGAEEWHPALSRLLQRADLGITNFVIQKRAYLQGTRMPVNTNAIFDNLTSTSNERINSFVTDNRDQQLTISHQGDGFTSAFLFNEESRGTRRIFLLGLLLLPEISNENIVVIDEIDASLHTQLVQAVLSLFVKQDTSGAQLVFNTHDASLLRSGLLDRDQIWFVEKDNEGASHLYPLLDFQPQDNGETLEESYLYGRFGAVPLIDRLTWQEIKGDAAS